MFDETDNEPDDEKKKDDKEGTTEVKEEILLKTKKVRVKRPLTEEDLVGYDGIDRIYSEFPNSCKYQIRGTEDIYLNKLITLYKEWAFQMNPSIAFTDLIQKCETLGSKGKLKTHLTRMRERQRDKYNATKSNTTI